MHWIHSQKCYIVRYRQTRNKTRCMGDWDRFLNSCWAPSAKFHQVFIHITGFLPIFIMWPLSTDGPLKLPHFIHIGFCIKRLILYFGFCKIRQNLHGCLQRVYIAVCENIDGIFFHWWQRDEIYTNNSDFIEMSNMSRLHPKSSSRLQKISFCIVNYKTL